MERTRSLPSAILATLPVILAWAAGMIATFPNLEPWYAGLVKPGFNPPDWVFGPVWITLYVLMAIAAWRILRSDHRSRPLALTVFFLQLALNAIWSWMFFAAHSPAWGLLNIGPQFILVVVAARMFFRIDTAAGWCLVPLCIWVGFAAVLNLSIWWLNG